MWWIVLALFMDVKNRGEKLEGIAVKTSGSRRSRTLDA
jgi:hypothetical protein